jgi:hypothetical protein
VEKESYLIRATREDQKKHNSRTMWGYKRNIRIGNAIRRKSVKEGHLKWE